MPIDPAHGRHIPSGQQLARLLAEVFRRQRAEAVASLRAGRFPDFTRWTPALVDALTLLLAPHARRGGNQALRQVRQKSFGYGYTPWDRRGVSVLLYRKKAATLEDAFDVFNPRVLEFLRQQVFHFVDSTNRTTGGRLREALSLGLREGDTPLELATRVADIFTPARAQGIAMTEASRAQHAGEVLAAKESDVVRGKRWLVSADACPLCLELDGKEVGLDEPFHVDPKGGPYAVIYHPPRHPL